MPNAPFEKADLSQAVAMPHASASRPSLATLAAGSLASFVGFASSFAIVVKGFLAMGATPAQATSGLIAVAFAMGFSSPSSFTFAFRRAVGISPSQFRQRQTRGLQSA